MHEKNTPPTHMTCPCLTTRWSSRTRLLDLLPVVHVEQVVVASQGPSRVVVSAIELEELAVQGVVIIYRQLMQELQKGLREEQVFVLHLEPGDRQHLVNTN